MGFWSKLKQALGMAEEIAPMLPIPEKAKSVVSKVGTAERAVEDVVRELKPKKKAPKS